MSETENKDHKAPFSLIPIEGQSGEAGLCVDGVCAIPDPLPAGSDGTGDDRQREANPTATGKAPN